MDIKSIANVEPYEPYKNGGIVVESSFKLLNKKETIIPLSYKPHQPKGGE